MTKTKTLISIISLFMLLGCSVTRNIPDGELLYVGVKRIKIDKPENLMLTETERTQITSPFSVAPNNPLYSPYVRGIIPIGLWVNNWEISEKSSKTKKWLYHKFAKEPVLISKVNPELRTRMVIANLKSFGYFDVKSNYEIDTLKRNNKKARISYVVNISKPYLYRYIHYDGWGNTPFEAIVRNTQKYSYIEQGTPFNVEAILKEKQRIANIIRNRGYYYFQPTYIDIDADTTVGNKRLDLRIYLKKNIPDYVMKKYSFRNVTLNIKSLNTATDIKSGIEYNNDSIGIRYDIPKRIEPKYLFDAFEIKPGDIYSLEMEDRTHSELIKRGIFRYVNSNVQIVDSIRNKIDITYNSELTEQYYTEVEAGFAYKSNSLIGPGLSFSFVNRNFMKKSRNLTLKLRGGYEWQVGVGENNVDKDNSLFNSYELGIDVNMSIPYLTLPDFLRPTKGLSEKTDFQINASILNRRNFFRMISWGGMISYDYNYSKNHIHTITPLKISYTYLAKTTDAFDLAMKDNRAIALSFQNQFIPTFGYKYTYDHPASYKNPNRLFFQVSVSEAGNLISSLKDLFSNNNSLDRTIFNTNYSQFVKATTEIIVHKKVRNMNSILAMRFYAGVGYAYGNSSVMPYSEQFYTGGANSIRAFHIRSIGPGSYHQPDENVLAYMDQTGDIKLEANIEFRFPITDKLNGALFADAGNVWLLKEDKSRLGGEFKFENLLKESAFGIGFGLRYDLGLLVGRLDCGLAVHAPYETGIRGYFNIPNFFSKGIVFNLAIGYPF